MNRESTRPYREAQTTILKRVRALPVETLVLEEALGRVLAVDLPARFDLPEAAKSAIDGFTYAFDDVAAYPVTLRIVGESRAGGPFDGRVGPGEAVATMTGAVVPEGTDTAVRIEDVTVTGDRVTIPRAPKKGDLINPAGSELRRGEAAVRAGTLLDYRTVALLANLGYYRLEVVARPRIGILVTGDEVLEPWERPERAGVRNSNRYILSGMLAPLAEVHYYGIVRDEPTVMIPRFAEALAANDILLSSGGASKGAYDFTRDIAAELGLEVAFTATNIKPGRPLIFGSRGEKLFYGLPGYPAALLANALLFLLPAVRKMAGLAAIQTRELAAVAAEPLRAKPGRVDLIRVDLQAREGRLYARSAGSQQTSNFRTMAECDALAVLDEERGTAAAGELVPVLLLHSWLTA